MNRFKIKKYSWAPQCLDILTLTRNEATQSDIGPWLTVNPPLRNFNLRLKILKIISVYNGS